MYSLIIVLGVHQKRKRTLLAGTLPGLDAMSIFHCQCYAKCAVCHRPHFVLKGKAADGRWMTQHAEPYPPGMGSVDADMAARCMGCWCY